jgi:hypothetical protein
MKVATPKSPMSLSNGLLLIQFSLAVASSGAALLMLRRNNQKMLELRDSVLRADAEGTDTSEPLKNLQEFVTSHINTRLPRLGNNPPITLKNTYEKLKTVESQRVSDARVAQAAEATSYCEQNVVGGRLSVRAQCVADYTAARPIVEREILPDLYRYNFASPSWSFDPAGWSILLAAGIWLWLLLAVALRIFIKQRVIDKTP